MQESPIFVRTFDPLLWLLPTLQKFPKEQRFILAARIHDAAFNLKPAYRAGPIISA